MKKNRDAFMPHDVVTNKKPIPDLYGTIPPGSLMMVETGDCFIDEAGKKVIEVQIRKISWPYKYSMGTTVEVNNLIKIGTLFGKEY